MSGDLIVDYDALITAAQAMKTAAARIEQAANAFGGASELSDDAFTDKGTKTAAWYREERDALRALGASSARAYDDMGLAYSRSAMMLRLIEGRLGKDAAGLVEGGR